MHGRRGALSWRARSSLSSGTNRTLTLTLALTLALTPTPNPSPNPGPSRNPDQVEHRGILHFYSNEKEYR